MKQVFNNLNLDIHYTDFLESIVDHMATALLVIDAQGRIVGANQTLARQTGYDLSALIGQTCDVLDGDTCRGPAGECFFPECELFKKGHVEQKRCTIRCRDGRRLQIVKDGATLKDKHGRTMAGVEILTDITLLVERERELAFLKKRFSDIEGFHGLIGQTPLMRELFDMIRNAAVSDAPVLIFGESGTGKELAARAIHDESPRAKGPYLMVNCAALNRNLLESELFGHIRGAFTGANRTRIGRFEAAQGGSILLDEIGDLPLEVQAKLLRVLEAGVIEKVGDHSPLHVNVRVIAATHRHLADMAAAGDFREDLFYRLNVIPIFLPPLRDRVDDIPLLINHFLSRIEHSTGRSLTVDAGALDRLLNYPWPGNVRELRNILEYAAVTNSGGVIRPNNLPSQLQPNDRRRTGPAVEAKPNQTIPSKSPNEESQQIMAALDRANGNKSEAARLLGISRVGLWKKMKRLNLADSVR